MEEYYIIICKQLPYKQLPCKQLPCLQLLYTNAQYKLIIIKSHNDTMHR